MKQMTSLLGKGLLCLCIGFSVVIAKASYTDNATRIYNFFRAHTNGFPEIKPVDTIAIGSFNLVTGEFTGKGSEVIEIPNSHGGTTPHAPILLCYGQRSVAKFMLSSSEYTELTFDGQHYNNNGKNFICVPIARRGIRRFIISSGAHLFSNDLNFRPYLVNAIGAFTLAEVPIGIIYQPCENNASTNYAVYNTIESLKTTISISNSKSNSITKSSMDDFSSVVSLASQAASAIQNIEGYEEFGKALSFGLSGLPKTNITETVGQTVDNKYEISYEKIESISSSTDSLTPSSGNIFVYLKNARFIYVIKNGVMTISLLDFEKHVRWPARFLKENDPERYDRLKKLDPFTLTATPNLAGNRRFLHDTEGPYDIADGVPMTKKQSEIQQSTTAHIEMNYSTKIIDHQAGWIGSLLGDESYTKTITLSESRSTATTTTEEKCSEVYLFTSPNEAREYDIYVDNLFKTMAVIDLSHGSTKTPTLVGVLLDVNKKPLVNTLVYVQVNGAKRTTLTDQNGKYTFYSSELKGYRGRPAVLKKTPTKTVAIKENKS